MVKCHTKREPTCSGDECYCAECRGEVVIKGERLPIDVEIVSDYDRARLDAEGQDRQQVQEVREGRESPEVQNVKEVSSDANDEIVSDYDRARLDAEGQEVANDAESEDDRSSISSVHTPAHVPSFFSSSEDSSDEESNIEDPELNRKSHDSGNSNYASYENLTLYATKKKYDR